MTKLLPVRHAVRPGRGYFFRVNHSIPSPPLWERVRVRGQLGLTAFPGIGSQAMGVDDVLRPKREEILRIARKHGVARVQVFGSFARGEASESSDLDLLIEVEGPTPPWFPGGLVADVEALLGRCVEVIEPDAPQEAIRARVLQEAVPL